MDDAELQRHSAEFLAAWNSQDAERVLFFYMEDCRCFDQMSVFGAPRGKGG